MRITAGVQSEGTEGDRADRICLKKYNYYLLLLLLLSLDKKLGGGLFCDLKKAFDCVNHGILLEMMKFYGMLGTGHKLMKSYLDNRYQRTVIKDSKSNKIFPIW